MKYVVCRIGLLAAVMSLVLAVPARAEQPPRIVISEVNWAGSARSTADEWIELANLSATPVDVGGWVVSGIASGGGAISLAEGTVIAAGDTLLIANYAMSTSSTLATQPDLITTAVSIANRALNILLTMPDGTVVDSAIDAGDLEFGSSALFASMERDLTTMNWRTADTSLNLLDGQLGTPDTIPVISPMETPVAEEPVAEESVTEIPVEEPILQEPTVEEPVEGTLPEEVPTEMSSEPTITPELIVEETVVVEPIVEEPLEEVTATDLEVPVEYVPVEQPVVEEAPAAPGPIIDPVPEPIAEPVDVPLEEPMDERTPEPPAPTTARTGNVVLSEFVSSPAEGNEWIEVMNADVEPIDLTGWQVTDASGKFTTLVSVTLDPGAFYVISKPLGILNNDADSIMLYDSNHRMVNVVSYTKDTAPASGESLAWNGSAWLRTPLVTSGSANLFPPPEEPAVPEAIEVTTTEEPEEYAFSDTKSVEGSAVPDDDADSASIATIDDVATPTRVTVVASATPAKHTASSTKKSSNASAKKSSNKTAAVTARSVTSLDDVAAEERVQFTGAVIALPGTFGSQIAVLDGAVLYMHSADWPALQIGDVIRAEGTVSISRGEKRIKVTAADVTVTGHSDVLAGTLSNRTPSLVNIKGRVLGRDSDTITIDVDGEKIFVRATDHSGVTWSDMTTTTVVVTGILRTIDGERVLMPRNVDDVQFLQEETISDTSAAATSSFNARPWIGGGLLASSAAALVYWFIRSRQQHVLVTA